METFALYLLKSVIWLTGFALVYILFLRNERYFELNRIFLVSGMAAAFMLPFLSFSYKVVLPAVTVGQSDNAVGGAIQSTNVHLSTPDLKTVLFFLYLAGFLFIASMILKQGRSLHRAIKKAGKAPSHKVKLVRSDEYDSAFSFFSWVFVNPSFSDIEIREIMNHEMVHIRQKHWLDLALAQLLCIMQWFNPVIWIYIRLIRQNHEYIADKVALQRTSDPAIYKAALLNQIVGAPVISLVNSFNYSLNKKRFTMMENIFNSPFRKMKLLLILPVFALVFYAFAKPDYQYAASNDNNVNQNLAPQSSDKKIKGSIVTSNGTPLQGAHIIVAGTTIGTSSDANGNFSLENVPADAALAVSYVGYKSKVIKSEFVSRNPIKMEQDTITILNEDISTPPPPPPPPPPSPLKEKSSNGEPSPINTDMFVAVEELPSFPGGTDAMGSWIIQNLKYPGEAYTKKITGKVYVDFMVSSTGKIRNVKVTRAVNPLLDAEAIRVIGSMPDWKPGMQHGKPVDVQLKVPVEFKLQ